MKRRLLIVLLVFSNLAFGGDLSDTKIPLLLAHGKAYVSGVNLKAYWVSEKLDGVRAYWDGQHLYTRNGRRIYSPDFFTANWPAETLDGELWLGRQRFEETSGLIRRQLRKNTASDQRWRQLRFMVFDLHQASLTFDQRLTRLRELVPGAQSPYLQLIEQRKISSEEALMAELGRIVDKGGEGLMLHRGAARYRAGRSADILKLKPFKDGEARVLAHVPGKGKHHGRLGSLLVKGQGPFAGRQFRIGTGFSDGERERPPAVGSVVTFRYQGLTKTGLPRFPVFLRIRPRL